MNSKMFVLAGLFLFPGVLAACVQNITVIPGVGTSYNVCSLPFNTTYDLEINATSGKIIAVSYIEDWLNATPSMTAPGSSNSSVLFNYTIRINIPASTAYNGSYARVVRFESEGLSKGQWQFNFTIDNSNITAGHLANESEISWCKNGTSKDPTASEVAAWFSRCAGIMNEVVNSRTVIKTVERDNPIPVVNASQFCSLEEAEFKRRADEIDLLNVQVKIVTADRDYLLNNVINQECRLEKTALGQCKLDWDNKRKLGVLSPDQVFVEDVCKTQIVSLQKCEDLRASVYKNYYGKGWVFFFAIIAATTTLIASIVVIVKHRKGGTF